MDKVKLDELRTRDPQNGGPVWGWILLERDERDALFAYIDELEAKIRRAQAGGSSLSGSGGGSGNTIQWLLTEDTTPPHAK